MGKNKILNDKTVSGEIYFEEGLFGFESYKRFFPVAVEEGSDAVLNLYSAEEEGVSFTLMNPFVLKEDYHPQISMEELKILGEVHDELDYSWYVICVLRNPLEKSSVNFRCPIVVNVLTRKAKQVILDNREYGFRQTLEELTGKERKAC